jgi:hypothetical protein
MPQLHHLSGAVVDVLTQALQRRARGTLLFVALLLCHTAGTAATGDGAHPVAVLHDGSSPLVSADFNGDGLADLAVAVPGRVAVHLRQNAGGFARQPAFTETVAAPAPQQTTSSRRALAAADLNGDGKTDVVVTDGTASVVSVLTGRGDGSFERATTIDGVSIPIALAVADLNGDAHPDIAVLSRGTNKVTVLIGDGRGVFKPYGQFATGFQPSSLVVGDFGTDGTRSARDGKLDLAATLTGEGQIAVLFGNGAGAFSAPRKFGSASVTAVVGADVNSDGAVDLITANSSAGAVSVNLGFAKGAHGSSRTSRSLPRLAMVCSRKRWLPWISTPTGRPTWRWWPNPSPPTRVASSCC